MAAGVRVHCRAGFPSPSNRECREKEQGHGGRRSGRGFGFCLTFRLSLGLGGARLGVGFLLAGPAVIGFVEAGALEDDGPAATEEAFELVLLARRALGQRRLGERLQLTEPVPAGPAFGVVGRHGWVVSPRWGSVCYVTVTQG